MTKKHGVGGKDWEQPGTSLAHEGGMEDHPMSVTNAKGIFHLPSISSDPEGRTCGTELSGAELKLLQSLLSQECGVYCDDVSFPLLQERARDRLRNRGLDSFYSYYRLLTSREGKQELAALVENAPLRPSGFFHDKPQLELFQKVILEELLRRKHARRD